MSVSFSSLSLLNAQCSSVISLDASPCQLYPIIGEVLTFTNAITANLNSTYSNTMYFNYFFCILFFCCCPAAKSQPRHDYIWLLGDSPVNTQFKIGGCTLDFNDNPVSITAVPIAGGSGLSYQPMSDENGKLLYYTNGCSIYTADFQVMEGGDTLNSGIEHQQFCDQGLGYPNGGISLPHPDKPGIYVFFHLATPDREPIIDVFYQTTIIYYLSAQSGGKKTTLRFVKL